MTSSGGMTPGDPLEGEERRAPERKPTVEERERAILGERPETSDAYDWAPPASVAAAAVPAAGGLVLAGWWRRAGAQLIDGLIIGLVALLLIVPIGIGALSADTDGGVVAAALGALLAVLVYSVVALLYAPVLMARTNGQTLGRMATGIRVVRANGASLTFGWAMLREVAIKALLFGVLGSFTGGLAYLLDNLWPLWDEENRALHDFLADTRVVRA